MNKNNIYIGFDSKEPIASEVCEYSLKKNSKGYLYVNHLRLDVLRKKGIYKEIMINYHRPNSLFLDF